MKERAFTEAAPRSPRRIVASSRMQLTNRDDAFGRACRDDRDHAVPVVPFPCRLWGSFQRRLPCHARLARFSRSRHAPASAVPSA